MCLGAGIFEEVLFRLILVTLLINAFNFFLKSKNFALLLSIFISGVLFSLFHYLGETAYSFTFYTLIVRCLGGFILAFIYI